MDTLKLDATMRTPAIEFAYVENRFSISGDAYAEDIVTFFEPILYELEKHLLSVAKERLEFHIRLTYFNSSAAKFLIRIFETIERAAKAGNHIDLNWHHHEEDELQKEFGEELATILSQTHFHLISFC